MTLTNFSDALYIEKCSVLLQTLAGCHVFTSSLSPEVLIIHKKEPAQEEFGKAAES